MQNIGRGVREDFYKAVEWYTKASEQGHSEAQLTLGNVYADGSGDINRQDYAKAVKWYTKAADQGNADALYNLAHMYDIGEGVPQNSDKAIELYTKAAKKGMKGAKHILEIKREYAAENLDQNSIKPSKQY